MSSLEQMHNFKYLPLEEKSEMPPGLPSLRPRPKFEIIWVCETPPIIVYSDVAIFPRLWGKRDVTHLIYVKSCITFSVVLTKTAWFQTFPSTKSKRRN